MNSQVKKLAYYHDRYGKMPLFDWASIVQSYKIVDEGFPYEYFICQDCETYLETRIRKFGLWDEPYIWYGKSFNKFTNKVKYPEFCIQDAVILVTTTCVCPPITEWGTAFLSAKTGLKLSNRRKDYYTEF